MIWVTEARHTNMVQMEQRLSMDSPLPFIEKILPNPTYQTLIL